MLSASQHLKTVRSLYPLGLGAFSFEQYFLILKQIETFENIAVDYGT